MRFFPYTPRRYQADLVDLISRTVSTRSHLVLESGTGTGKTACALAGVLRSLGEGEKLLYLTRTNSQQRQVMLELRRISKDEQVFGMGVQGRKGTCPLIRGDPSLQGGTSEELSRLCAEMKRKTLSGSDAGCPFYRRAHNLPDFARETMSFTLTGKGLDLVEGEVRDHGDPKVLEGVSVMNIVLVLRDRLRLALDEYLIEEDGLIPPFFMEEGLLGDFSITSKQLESAAKALLVHGEAIREGRKESGRLPRSYIHGLGSFLSLWIRMDEESFVKLVLGGDLPGFQGYCLDSSLACAPLLDCRSSIHMSGTLNPLEEYRDSVGLPADTVMREFPSPFPVDNRRVFYVRDLTTSYEELSRDAEMVGRIEDMVVRLCNILDRNTVVFFPSFSLMERFLGDGVRLRIRKRIHIEERGMSQVELMDTVQDFRECRDEGAVLFAVMGGRIGEGLDFPDRDLQVALIVGIPYPKPTARQRSLLHHYEIKFGKGWDYTVKAPALRKVLQAVGRLIRTEEDVGVAVLLDRRAERFASQIDLVPTDSPVRDLPGFLDARDPGGGSRTKST